ncbi:MAG: NAD-dependent epimerase/dehydratase family protein, partial [Anaerolineae bacterium]|nr:NAD-dependent epimerase/dehydratase family protein [Anaerolineae bacterium]
MKYFVTGATGFLGGYLARRLTQDGHEVIALVRTPSSAKNLADLGVTIAKGDITDKESMRAPMTGVDGVFHAAAWYKVGAKDSSMAQTINVEGTRNVLELMKELAIPKGVYTSTVAVFSDTKGELKDENYKFTGKFLSEYDRTKWEAHYLVAEPMMKAGLPLVTVMPGGIYGPGDQSDLHNAVVQYLQRKLPMIPAGMTLCWAHVEDVVEGHIQAMNQGKAGESYILAGPVQTLVGFFDMAERITGIPAPAIKMPPVMMKMTASLADVVGKVVTLPPTYTGEGLRVTAGVTY